MATFGSRPAENADPWYAAREAYDQSLEDAIEAVEENAAPVTGEYIVADVTGTDASAPVVTLS